MSLMKENTPLLVAILGILTLIQAVIVIVVGIAVACGAETILNEAVKYLTEHPVEGFDPKTLTTSTFVVAGALIAVYGLICAIIGYGMLQGWRIMWYIAVILYIFAVIGSLFTIMVGTGVITLIIALVVLYYLFRPNVKQHFSI